MTISQGINWRPQESSCNDPRVNRNNWKGMQPWMNEVANGGTGTKKRAILNADLDYGSSAGASIYDGEPNSWSDTGGDVTVYCWLLVTSETIPSGTRVWIELIDGYWEVVNARCA